MKVYTIRVKGPDGKIFPVQVAAVDIQDLIRKMRPMYDWKQYDVDGGSKAKRFTTLKKS